MGFPAAALLRLLIGWLGADLIRWLWDDAGRAPARREWEQRCAWCNGCYVLEQREQPPRDSVPPGWLGDEAHTMCWCSLRCWVEHWRADPRVEAPPVTIAAGMWREDWAETDDD